MRLLAPAKINLHLRVGKVRADGFHPLATWMCTVGLFDILTLERVQRDNPAPLALQQNASTTLPGSEVERPSPAQPLALTCDLPGLAVDASNLVVKAGSAFLREVVAENQPLPFVRAFLNKRIPMGAGLGGGSSDGAFTLMGLNSLCHAGRSAEFLSGFAARFGSDLSFFCFGPSSLCRGRGEAVTPITPPKPKAALLLLPEIHMPTPAVYRMFDTMGLGTSLEDSRFDEQLRQWGQVDAESLLQNLVNDLEAPAFAIAPELGVLRSRAEQIVSRPVRMSGSGSSLFTLYDDLDEAGLTERKLSSQLNVRCVAVPLAPKHQIATD